MTMPRYRVESAAAGPVPFFHRILTDSCLIARKVPAAANP